MSDTTRDQISNVLSLLAKVSTPDELADLIRANGITGRRYSGEVCPLSKLFRRLVNMKDFDTIIVNAIRVTWFSRDLACQNIPLPAPIGDFVSKFDNKDYPDLIA